METQYISYILLYNVDKVIQDFFLWHQLVCITSSLFVMFEKIKISGVCLALSEAE